MRVKVSTAGVEVITPPGLENDRASQFLRQNSRWVLHQLDFIERAVTLRTPQKPLAPESILYRGVPTRVEVLVEDSRRRHALTSHKEDRIVLRVSRRHPVDLNAALEAWLRRRAREAIAVRLRIRSRELRQKPGRVYIMGQRTKWGGCSGRRNLSFNWRLVMAPPDVLDYLVVHELAHLAEPYHSTKFWFIVRSFCPDFDRHRRWLAENEGRLMHAQPFQTPRQSAGLEPTGTAPMPR